MAYTPTRETDHVRKGLDRFLEQFKGKPVFEAILTACLTQVQKLEDAIWEVIMIRGIELSEGVGLDAIGRIVGRARLGLEDSDYRVALRAQIRINRSSGTPNDLIEVTDLSLPQTGFTAEYGEEYPAAVLITVNEQVTFLISVMFDNLIRTKAGGVRLFLFYTPSDPANIFQFAPDTSGTVDSSTGFGDVLDSGSGGHLVSMLSA